MAIFKKALLTLALPIAALATMTGMASAGVSSSTSSGYHWARSSGQQTLVVVQIEPSAAINRTHVLRAVARWNTNPKVAVVVRTCRPGENCLPIRGEARVGGKAPLAFRSGGHLITSANTYVIYDNRRGQNQASVANGICHEIGHGLGLNHGTVQGPCQNAYPTTYDQSLLSRIYNHVDTSGPAGV